MPVKLTMFFSENQSVRTAGWSESYIFSYTQLPLAYNALFLGSSNFVLGRLYCLGVGVVNTYNRLQLLPSSGLPPLPNPKAVIYPVGGIPLPVSSGAPSAYNPALNSYFADFSDTVLMLRGVAAGPGGSNTVRTFWIGGLPDEAQEIDWQNLKPNPVTGAVTNFFLNFFSGAFANSVYMRAQDESNPAYFRLASAYVPATTVWTINAHGFFQGQKVIASRFRGPAGAILPRGQYTVLSVVDADHVTLNISTVIGPVSSWGGFSAVRIAYNAITSTFYRGITNKKRGRPFGLLVGRRRTPSRQKA